MESEGAVGFIVHAFTRIHRGETQLCLTGRLAGGDTFVIVRTDERPRCHLRASDAEQARRYASVAKRSVSMTETDLRTMDGERCVTVSAHSQGELSDFAAMLAGRSIRTYEADVRLPEAFLMNHQVHGSVSIGGEWRPGSHVDRIYVDPEVSPATWSPSLSIASIDIETNPYGPEILAIAMHHRSCNGAVSERVLLRAPAREAENKDGWKRVFDEGAGSESWELAVLDDEEQLLKRWRDELVKLDPDLVTGWNVTAFDFERIFNRFSHYGIPFRLGRSGESGTFFSAAPGKPASVVVPGRQVLDGLRIARSGPRKFSDHSLETVAREVLGRGKQVGPSNTKEKLRLLDEMYRSDPLALCTYCLEDARLVSEILEKTGLLDLTLKRSLLIGVPLSRAWTSIAAFDFVYIEAMHRRRFVAPTVGVDPLPMESAPGGAIISPFSGLFENVLVFDFKSLYPSIIRTFNIDPLAYCPTSGDIQQADLLRAPNGACFRRGEAILPTLLERFFENREVAKRTGDQTAAYVYKILMNSFYGVLGARGCRFAGSAIAGAITAFGQEILYWCRDLLEEKGHHTLYGDTDSLFVESNLPRASSDATLQAAGERLCSMVNERLSEHVQAKYQVDSRLELEFEKVYLRFFVPPLRGQTASAPGAVQRGRAKGYAGYLHPLSAADIAPEAAIEVKGMEAVRRDWTQAAKDFQLTLLRMVFEDVTPGQIVAYVRRYVEAMRSGALDSKLVYSKALRKSVAQYTSSLPPHVQAARRLDKADQGGVVSYLWTTAGPQPTTARSAPIDYDHYVDRQLKPIAAAFSETLETDLERLFDADGQLELF